MLWFIFWVRKVTFHSVCMYVHVILLHCFPSLVFMFNLNKLWTNTFSRNYIVEKKKERHFIWVCMFCFHESAYWGQYFYVSNWRRDWHFTWSSEPCELSSSHLQGKAVQYLHFLVIRSKYWFDPLGWTHARYFTALNAPEPQKFVGGSKYSLWWSFIMILKTFPLDYVIILFRENWGWSL